MAPPPATGIPGVNRSLKIVAGGAGAVPALAIGIRPEAIAVAGDTLYIADREKQIVRAVDLNGGSQRAIAGDNSRTVAADLFNGDGGPGTASTLFSPVAVAADGQGNVYITEDGMQRVRKVDASGVISTVTKTGVQPSFVAAKPDGTIYLTQSGPIVYRIDPITRQLTPIAGNGQTNACQPDGVPATSGPVNPGSLALDPSGQLVFADLLCRKIRRLLPNGTLATVPSPDGPLGSLTVDPSGTIYYTDTTALFRLAADGTSTLVAGKAFPGLAPDGGPPAINIRGLAADSSGNIYTADLDDNVVRVWRTNGSTAVVAGNGTTGFGGEGVAATDALLNRPTDVAVGPDGSIYLADSWNNRVRRVDPAGVIRTVAGTGEPGFSGDSGPATAALLNEPTGVAVGSDGSVYIADRKNNAIRRVSPAGTITTVLGEANPASATLTRTHLPTDVIISPNGDPIVSDQFYVRRVLPNGTAQILAGNGQVGYSGDGGPASSASLQAVNQIALGPDGSVYLVDSGRVRRVDPQGTITRFAGTADASITVQDGVPATQSGLISAAGVVVDGHGDVYIGGSRDVRVVTPDGIIGPAAGAHQCASISTAQPASHKTVCAASGLALAGSTLYYADPQANRVRSFAVFPGPVTLQAPATVWRQPSTAPLDGVGTWMAAHNIAPSAGQAQPSYLVAQVFELAGGGSGSISLGVGPDGRFALLSTLAPDGTAQNAIVAFDWQDATLYFPFVYELSPGVLGGWVYDYPTGTWHAVGTLPIPAGWGKLAPTTFTAAVWYGAPQAQCTAFPFINAVFYGTTGYVGTTPHNASAVTTAYTDADCPIISVPSNPGDWPENHVGWHPTWIDGQPTFSPG